MNQPQKNNNKAKRAKKTTISSLSAKQAKEVYIKHSHRLHLRFANFEATESVNFEYTLTLNSVSISLLDINGTIVSPIKQSDKITADTGKPFYIQVNASISGPTPSGSLQLKYIPNGKNVFDSPQEFKFENSGNGGLFLPDVKLP